MPSRAQARALDCAPGDPLSPGFLCTGGAFIPPLAGAISDGHGYVASFAVPMIRYTALCVIAAARAAVHVREGKSLASTIQ